MHVRFASRGASPHLVGGCLNSAPCSRERLETAGGGEFLKHLLTRRDALPAAGPESTGFLPPFPSLLAESVDPSQDQGCLAG